MQQGGPRAVRTGPALAQPAGPRNITTLVWDRASSDPAFEMLRRQVDGEWRPVTAEQFCAEVTELARGLVGSGLQPGERVALMSRTRYEWAVVDFAVWVAGGVSVPVYETSAAEQLRWIVGDSGCSVVILETAEHAALWDRVAEGLPTVRDVWRIEADRSERGLAALVACGTGVSDEEVEARRTSVVAGDLATVIYTSGTTGRPKGCELTHANLLAEIDGILTGLHEVFGKPDAAALLFLPLAHVLARVIQLAVLAGGVTLGHTPDVKNLLGDLESFRPTFLLAVPRVFEKVYNASEQKADASGRGRIFRAAAATSVAFSQAADAGGAGPLLRVRHRVFDALVYGKLRAALGGRVEFAVCGGAPLGERLGHFFRGIGLTVLEGYGLTETTAAATVNTPSAVRIGTVGRPLPGVTVRIAQDGEIQIAGGQVFSGYSHDPAARAAAFTEDGYLRTGDLGELDAAGYLRVTGRSKEILVTAGGKNVAPAALEDRLRAAALVSQCMVVGDGKPYVAALVTLDSDAVTAWLAARHRPPLSLAEAAHDPQVAAGVQAAVDAANAEFSRAESIRRFRILEVDLTEASGHLTPSMKVRRAAVARDFAAEIEALYS
ncbi:long-chain acyl-CoA synthetase [Motilibacter peucedani]|uniref:Acyl-CoA synthetase n=1 Tax=Motilibacter peucedani TaxID=598650 RepID=A0A420XPD0_9ACTN|nr:long-chain fatty acid--CoA ligase [Motilibacter peucedani]RKS74060.1 long-chain acyl-CoA synthetase [Motilibacter peucedani]